MTAQHQLRVRPIAELLTYPPPGALLSELRAAWEQDAAGDDDASRWAAAQGLLDALQRGGGDGRGGDGDGGGEGGEGEGARTSVDARIRRHAVRQLTELQTTISRRVSGGRAAPTPPSAAAEERAVQAYRLLTSARASMLHALRSAEARGAQRADALALTLQLEVLNQIEGLHDNLLIELTEQALGLDMSSKGSGSGGGSAQRALQCQHLLHTKVRVPRELYLLRSAAVFA